MMLSLTKTYSPANLVKLCIQMILIKSNKTGKCKLLPGGGGGGGSGSNGHFALVLPGLGG